MKEVIWLAIGIVIGHRMATLSAENKQLKRKRKGEESS